MQYLDPLGCSDHLRMEAQVSLGGILRRHNVMIPNVWKTDFQGMIGAAAMMDWTMPQTDDINSVWDVFKLNLQTLCQRFVPMKKAAAANRGPPWMDRQLKTKLNNRRRAWNLFKVTGSLTDYGIYKVHRNICNSLKKAKRMNYEANLIDQAKSIPQKVFTYINRRLKRTDELPPLLDENGQTVDDDMERAFLLAKTYSSVYSSDNQTVQQDQNDSTGQYIQCCAEDVRVILKHLHTHKAPGSDGIHPLILQNLSQIIDAPLANIFNISLATGKIPSAWKEAIIKPFYKGGNKHQPGNYRPVSLTSVISKVMEKIIKYHMQKHIDATGIQTPHQHGFVSKRSCVTNLLIARENWVKALDQGEDVDVIFTDFSKAFDRVNHNILIGMLHQYDFPVQLIRWVRDFLQDRHFMVRVNGVLSPKFSVKSGVPQGSVLGPILFNLYVNKLPSLITSHCIMFADDTKSWRVIKTEEDRIELQNTIRSTADWADEVMLPINSKKCQHLAIGRSRDSTEYNINGMTITQESEVKDLGIITRSDLKTKSHTTKIVAKGYRMLWALRRSISLWTLETVPKLLATFIRPLLEYGAPSYFPITKGESNQLERIQRTATRLIPQLRGLDYMDRCKNMNLYTLEYRRSRMDMIFLYRVLKQHSIPELSDLFQLSIMTNTRGHGLKLEKPRLRKLSTVMTLSSRAVNLWNSLPNSVISATTVDTFKRSLDDYLWNNLGTWKSNPIPGEPYPRIP